jgi:serine/threonine protein kinase
MSLAATGTVYAIGTPEYMSPEQVRQNDMDGRSDLYSLGMVFYEMLTGDLPFHKESQAEWFLAHVHEAPRPLHEDAARLRIPTAPRTAPPSSKQLKPAKETARRSHPWRPRPDEPQEEEPSASPPPFPPSSRVGRRGA